MATANSTSPPRWSLVGAQVAAAVAVLACVVARPSGDLLGAVGLRGWTAALVGLTVLVNAARALSQAPFMLASRTTSIRRWAGDQAKALAGAIVVGAALTIPLYALIRATPEWWLWAWAGFAFVTVAAQAAMPVLVRVQTGPLSPASPSLACGIAAIAALAGVDLAGGVLVADHVVNRAPRCNAYVVGCGRSRRVVLESGVASWPGDLLDQVIAHEIGHWHLRHGIRRLPVTLLAQLGTFALAAALLSWRPLLAWAGVAQLGDPQSYPLLLLLTTVIVLPARLALAAYDRAQERQADRFALALLGNPSRFAAMLDLAARDGGAPRHLPWWRRLTASHPPIDERILAASTRSPS